MHPGELEENVEWIKSHTQKGGVIRVIIIIRIDYKYVTSDTWSVIRLMKYVIK